MAFFLALVALFLNVLSSIQFGGAQLGSPDNSQLNDGPYIQVYPPVDLTQDQQSCSPQNSSTGSCPLFIGLILSFGGDYDSSGSVPGVQIALDQINADPDLLPGYTLHYTLTDSNCSRVTALEALTSQLFYPPTKIGILGSGCSVATEPTAEVSRFYNVTQISHISSSPELSDRDRFRYYFQLLGSDVNLAFGFFGVIRQFEWTRVSIIVQDENLFTAAMSQLRSLLSSANISSTETRFRSNEDITATLGANPFNPEYRIVVLSMYLPRARQILCKAYQQGVRYPQYLFLVYPYYSILPRWWEGTVEEQEELLESFGCNATQRESVLPFSLGPIIDEFISENATRSDSGLNGSQFLTYYDSYFKQAPLNLTSNIAAQQNYDATWTLARALDKVIKDIRNDSAVRSELSQFNDGFSSTLEGVEFGLQHFTYNNSGVLRRIYSYLEKSDFTGITGQVRFDSNGVRRVGRANVFSHQYIGEGSNRQLEPVLIGSVNFTDKENVQFSFVDGYTEEMIWSTAGRPYDGQPNIVTVSVSVGLTVVFILLAAVGIIFAIICLVFNFTFRKKKIIRPSSPNLSTLIGIGAIILYINVFFFVIPTTNPTAIAVFCNLNPWFTAVGYSLCYGTILVKMFRVYYIINFPSPTQKNVIKDWMLALGVLVLVVVDLIILITYTVVEGVRGNLSAQRVPNRENPEDMVGERAIIFRFYIYICDSTARDITLGILYGYKALLQLIALILAFSIRNVKFKVLNDSPYIALAIYVTSIVTAVIIVCTYSLKDIINGYAVVFGLGFLIGTTVILSLVFIPNMINLYQDPEGENIRRMTIERGPSGTGISLNTMTVNNGNSILGTAVSRATVSRLSTERPPLATINPSEEPVAIQPLSFVSDETNTPVPDDVVEL